MSMSNAEKLRLASNGWGKTGHGPVETTIPHGMAVAPGKPGTDPLTFTEDDEAEFKAVKDAYLQRQPTLTVREDRPLSRIGEEGEPDTFAVDDGTIPVDLEESEDEQP